ncbi:MAG: DNA topoisomerase IV subunit A, partial [Rhodobiaceae bacterium]|nr:DNA topoisomerase IV subunit A [Rhodobiaceae bacterium]
GDNAAAMRYTEARLTAVAQALLDGIDEDAVDFRETYDGEDKEPIVLPGAFPNLLANGATGIAVGMATSIPPHNAAELCDVALALIEDRETPVERLLEMLPGPDFPTGGTIVEPRHTIAEAYRTGRGGFRVRARWEKEDTGRGTYQIVVTEIPFQVQKSRLIEKIAELMLARKLPLLADIRDESAEDIRLVLEPKSRTVDPVILMESLFRVTDLQTRVPLNMNVLSGGKVPSVMGLSEVMLAWLDHRRDVLQRRSRFRVEKIAHRLEVLGGYLVAYLNLDEVIRIIREEDEPKPALIAAFSLTDVQAEAILNMRLRSLRRLEEMEIRREHDELTTEKAGLEALLASPARQWKKIGSEIAAIRKTFGPDTVLGRRRTDFADAPETGEAEIVEAMIEREPVTIVISDKGWVRALKGHMQDLSSVAFKNDDHLRFAIQAQTTDKLVLFATDGRFFTLGCDKLPGGRGHGEPLRLMVDLGEEQDIVAAFAHDPARRLLVAGSDGRGFVLEEKDVIAMTRKGKQALNVDAGTEAAFCVSAAGDMVGVIGENRKLLLFPAEQVPVMARGKGVRLQRYKDGGTADICFFNRGEGLSWTDAAGRVHTRAVDEMRDWLGDRAQTGRMAPNGFPRNGRFDGRPKQGSR